MNNIILSTQGFSVWSQVALKRIEQAKTNGIPLGSASYRFRHWKLDTLSILSNNNVSFSKDDESTFTCIDASCEAIFFDQTPYTFSITLPKGTKSAAVFSPIATWCEAAFWDKESHKLNVPINFGNDLGEFELCWEWEDQDGIRKNATFSGEVYSTKLDIYSDFQVMIDEVEERFDWIKLDFLRQTRWGWSVNQNVESNEMSWIIIFQEVRDSMEGRLQKLIKQHRRKLTPDIKMVRADRLRKITPMLEEKVAEGLRDNPNRRYRYEKRILSADTPENRYMKHILFQTVNQLNAVISRLEPIERIADLFKDRLKEWSSDWSLLKQHHFWRGIGRFTGLRGESLILSQDPLYAAIRRAWFLLQQGLSFLDDDLKGGIQNVAQLYEVWCFVKLDELISSEKIGNQDWEPFGFPQEVDFDDDDFEQQRDELRTGSVKIEYKHKDLSNVKLSLLFQPTASSSISSDGLWDGMYSTPVDQKPDIVLRLHRNDLPKQPVYTWIFDAKYRIKENKAPDDAINQMHRYRDAILWHDEQQGVGGLKRESIGAYVLYPGNENELSDHSKQIKSIERTNIGAFPLTPNQSADGSSSFEKLNEQVNDLITISQDYSSVNEKDKSYYTSVPTVKEPFASPVCAKCKTVSKDNMNTKAYWDKCRYYRLPIERIKNEGLRVTEWDFIIPITIKGEQLANLPILKFEEKSRKEISEIYDIYDSPQNAEKRYILFTLGDPLSNMPR